MDDDGIVWRAGVYGFGDFQGYVGTNVLPNEVWADRFASEEAERAAKLWGSYELDELRAMPSQPAIEPAIGDADLKINLGRRRVWLTRDDTIVVQDMTRSGWTLESIDAVEPVGLVEIARRLGVARATVDQWRTRGLLPEPRWTVGGRPAWSWADVAEWARQTGRLADGI